MPALVPLLVALYLLGLLGGLFVILRATTRINSSDVASWPSTVDLYAAIVTGIFKSGSTTARVEGLQVGGGMCAVRAFRARHGLPDWPLCAAGHRHQAAALRPPQAPALPGADGLPPAPC